MGNDFLTVSKAESPKSRCHYVWVLLLDGSYPCLFTWPFLCAYTTCVSSSSYKDTSPIGVESTLLISFNLNCLFQVLSPHQG